MGIAIDSGKTLQEQAAGVSLSWTWMGITRTLKGEEKEKAAELWDANPEVLSLSKKLINTKNEWFSVLTKIKSKATSLWIDSSLPWVDKGVRLMKKEVLNDFETQMEDYKERLKDGVGMLVKNWGAVKSESKDLLGDLYRENDYVSDPTGLFSFEVGHPNLSPPDYLMTINPKLYEQEKARIAKMFDKALEVAVENYGSELHKLVAGMVEKLAPGPNGELKQIKNTSIETFLTFIDSFKKMNVTSSADLDALVNQAEDLVGGMNLKKIKNGEQDRVELTKAFEQLGLAIESKIVPKQRRKLILGAPVLKIAATGTEGVA
jgi:hypothetical protein